MMSNNNTLDLVFLIDTSGSMYSNKMAAVNAALVECVEVIRANIRQSGSAVNVKYMTFNSDASDLKHIPDISNTGFPKHKVESKDGFYKLTRFEALYDGIISFMDGMGNANAGLILITDGKAIDTDKYREKLELVKSNDFFRKAKRVAVCVEKDAFITDVDLLEFVGYKADKIIDLQRLPTEIDGICKQLLNANYGPDISSNTYDDIFGDY